jgi:hypothetical protein
MDLGLRGRVILVTGGARSVGLGIADVLAAEGLWRSTPGDCAVKAQPEGCRFTQRRHRFLPPHA